MFLRNLLLNEKHPLYNRALHINGTFKEIEKTDIETSKPYIDALKADYTIVEAIVKQMSELYLPSLLGGILMAIYRFDDRGGIEIDFGGIKPSEEIRTKMKSVKYRWNPKKMIWWAYKNKNTIAVAKELCGESAASVTTRVAPPSLVPSAPATKLCARNISTEDYALKIKIKDIVNASETQLEEWEHKLKTYVNEVMTEDNAEHTGNAVIIEVKNRYG